MKKTMMLFVTLALLASCALADVDSLRCRMVDWIDAEGYSMYHGPEDEIFFYAGTCYWDLAMGDSFLVWVPGGDSIISLSTYESDSLKFLGGFRGDRIYTAVAMKDSLMILTSNEHRLYSFYTDKTLDWTYLDQILVPFARFHYAVIEDSFLYTVNLDDISIYSINIADPESMFVYRTFPFFGECGLEIIDGYAYTAWGNTELIPDPVWEICRPYWGIARADIINSAEPEVDSSYIYFNRKLGDIGSNDSLVFYVNTELSDYSETTDWTYIVGQSYLGVWGYDYSYTWPGLDGEMAFGVDVLNEHLVAVGFEHGLSVLNIDDLDSIYEVAYYIDEDSTMDITHFAMKDTRIYAMGHPRSGYARLYMFELDTTVINGIGESPTMRPEDIAISVYPNPFNSAVSIMVEQTFLSVQNGQTGMSDLPIVEIFDINGRMVAEIPANGAVGAYRIRPKNGSTRLTPTNSEYVWTPDESLGSGVYLVRAWVADNYITKNIIYLK